MKTYPSLKYPGDEETEGLFASGTVYIQEKLDGSNFRFTNEDGELKFGSRRTEGENLHRDQFEDPIEFANDRIGVGDILYVEDMFEQPVVLFGEAMMPHTISYDWEETPDLIGFDVWLEEDQEFAHPEEAQRAFEKLGIPFAPMVDVIEASEWDNYDFEVPKSEYTGGKAEGVVFKNPENNVYGKWVREDFKEKNKKKFGKPKKYQESGAEKLAYQYVTEQRIRKAIHRLHDEEGEEIRMEMMGEGLPQEVISDFVDEEGLTVFMEENWEVDISDFRSVVSSRTAEVLRKVIDERVKEKL